MPKRSQRRRQPAKSTPTSGFLNARVIGAGLVVAALLVGAVILFAVLGGGSESTDEPDVAAGIGDEYRALPSEMIDGFALGSLDAPMTLTVFEDFQCPYCILFSSTVEPVIVEEFVATRQIRLEFRNLPILGQESGTAATGAVCAARENRFWDFASSIFALQVAAGQINDERLNVGRLDAESLVEIAGGLGMETGSFESCLASAGALSEVQAHIDEAQSFGLRGTPSFLLNGIPIDRRPGSVDGWRELLNKRLAISE